MSWPHAPSKQVNHPGAYIITAGTHYKQHFFDSDDKLRLLQEITFGAALETGWELQAWAFFSNHYHLVGLSHAENGVHELTKRIHTRSATKLNQLDQTPKRRVWYRCWDTHLTYEKSYLARLAYVHTNPAKHLEIHPLDYEFCSLGWFEKQADKPFVESVLSFKTDSIIIQDDF
jgi:putative transposase